MSATVDPGVFDAARLREFRSAAGLSRSRLAGLLGASPAAVSRWEDGSSRPSPAMSARIAELVAGRARDPSDPSVFASHGATGHGAHLRDADDGEPTGVATSPTPHPPVLSRVRRGNDLAVAGSESLTAILERHGAAAPTAQAPPAGGMSAGKNTYTYDAHTYHTKVPPQGIAELLRHYLPEGGLVLDPFSGSGMTGVAAATVGADCVLNELSPAAAFLGSRFASTVDVRRFDEAVQWVLAETSGVRSALYSTECRECRNETELLYVVWSYRVLCYECESEFQLWDHCRSYGRTVREHKILTEFDCPACRTRVSKRRLGRTLAEPVEIGYKCCGSRQKEVNHPPNPADLALISRIDADPPRSAVPFPTDELPDGVNLNQPKRHGLTSVDRFYTARNLAAASAIWSAIHRIDDEQLAAQVAFAFTGLYRRITKFSEFRFWGGSGNSARLNVPFIYDEANVFVAFARKAKAVADHLATTSTAYTGSVSAHIGSATDLAMLPDRSIDLIFTDPPFGANINYSEMNLLWESWLGARTDATDEAIISKPQHKDAHAYGELMTRALRECHRVLRDESWLLLVFMNSSARVWQELNDAIRDSGFEIVSADVFDKQHGTFTHFVHANTPGADLVLHCRKTGSTDAAVPSDVASTLDEFLAGVDEGQYRQSFLHVRRPAEKDLRRLYSEWVSQAMTRRQPVLDFSAFREVVTETWQRDP